jgi:hypothetical protein
MEPGFRIKSGMTECEIASSLPLLAMEEGIVSIKM